MFGHGGSTDLRDTRAKEYHRTGSGGRSRFAISQRRGAGRSVRSGEGMSRDLQAAAMAREVGNRS